MQFSCECFEDQSLCYLRADYSLVCGPIDPARPYSNSPLEHTPEYAAVRSLAYLVVLAYPIAQPLTFAYVCFKIRHTVRALRTTRFSRALNFLYKYYEPPFFYWEVIHARPVFLIRQHPFREPAAAMVGTSSPARPAFAAHLFLR